MRQRACDGLHHEAHHRDNNRREHVYQSFCNKSFWKRQKILDLRKRQPLTEMWDYASTALQSRATDCESYPNLVSSPETQLGELVAVVFITPAPVTRVWEWYRCTQRGMSPHVTTWHTSQQSQRSDIQSNREVAKKTTVKMMPCLRWTCISKINKGKWTKTSRTVDPDCPSPLHFI